MRPGTVGLVCVSALGIALVGVGSAGTGGSVKALAAATPMNVNVSQRPGNESEETVAVNPTDPRNIVIETNIAPRAAGLFEAVSFDGGTTWPIHRVIATGPDDPLKGACCDASLSFDQYGNLFMTYLYLIGGTVPNVVPVALSTDKGVTFNVIANIDSSAKRNATNGDDRGLFRFVDQPTITTGANQAWLVFNAGGPIVATGARVTGLGQVGSFITAEVVPGTNNCTYGDVAIGPNGQVMEACALTESGQGGGKIYVNVDPDGLGPAGFDDHSVFVVATHVSATIKTVDAKTLAQRQWKSELLALGFAARIAA